MRLLMLGNSFTYANDLPKVLSEILDAEVVQHTMGGITLADQINTDTDFGKDTITALDRESWDYVVLQEMSRLPVTSKSIFMNSVELLCNEIRDAGAVPQKRRAAYKKGQEGSLLRFRRAYVHAFRHHRSSGPHSERGSCGCHRE